MPKRAGRSSLALAAGLLVLVACTPPALSDTPDGMLAPFPADQAGRAVPFEQMVPALIEQAVVLAVAPDRPPAPPVSPPRGLEPLADLRNEPVLVLTPRGAFGLSAPWPAVRDWTLRPPTKDELVVVPLGRLDAGSPAAAWEPALAWLAAESLRERPGVQRYSGAVLLVAAGAGPAADPRAAAAVLTRLGAARRAKVVVLGPDGRWGAVPLPSATLPVRALVERAKAAAAGAPDAGTAAAAPGQPFRPASAPDAATPPSTPERARLDAILATPIPGPRCHEASIATEAELPAAAERLRTGDPHDELAVTGLNPTLHRYLHPEELLPPELAGRVRLDDRCTP